VGFTEMLEDQCFAPQAIHHARITHEKKVYCDKDTVNLRNLTYKCYSLSQADKTGKKYGRSLERDLPL